MTMSTSSNVAQDLSGPVLHMGTDAPQQAGDLAEFIAEQLRQALVLRSRATLIVSGGRTPLAMWQALCRLPLDWRRVDITLADERWVPPDHPASNEALVRQHLLQGLAADAHWVPLYNGAVTPQAALPALEALLVSCIQWPADVVVLGMGADGHTASWFPGQELPEDGGLCMAVAAPPAPNVTEPRVSLTPRALLDARCLIVHLQGLDKEATLSGALLPPGDEPSGTANAKTLALSLPIRRALWAPGQTCHVYFSE